MDTRKIADLLRATIDPNQRQQAEEQLTQARAHVVLTHPFSFLSAGFRAWSAFVSRL